MTLTSGTRIGPYEIKSPLGEGGMGIVYRARDTQLQRDVALKLLPDSFAQDADRLARFQREAQVLASLNHPNIAQIYGLDGSGTTRCIVMELVEGETLQDRLQRGPIPVDEALPIARQIAEAVEVAHEKGIIHRDLKPANIKLTSDGSVKVLDFGLAKAMQEEPTNTGFSNSPTLSLAATNAGVILGTAAYMSPEQAKGKNVDKRADIWAFGVVVWEMLTDRRLFDGETASETMAAVMMKEPDWIGLPAKTPLHVRELLRRCLTKEPRNRLRDIGEARLVLSAPMEEQLKVEPFHIGRSNKLASLLAGLLVVSVAALGVIGFVHFRETASVQGTLRFQISTPGITAADFLALSPDGKNLAFIASDGGLTPLWVRALDEQEPRALAGTDGAMFPFWSPDGTYLAFFQRGKLKKIAAAGGPSLTVCDAVSGRGGTWNRDGVIVFSPGPTNELFKVAAAGGVPVPVTKLPVGTAGHRFPTFLPDGIHFLYSAGADKPEFAGLFLGSLDGTSSARILPDATNALYVPPLVRGASGYVLFRREGTLLTQRVDSKTFYTDGDPIPVAERVANSANLSFGAFSVSENGMLVYRSSVATNQELVWMDRTGKRLRTVSKPGAFVAPIALSPDEKTVAVSVGTQVHADIWLVDMARDVISRFTFRSGGNPGAAWSPGGERIVFSLRDESATFYLYQKRLSGNQEELVLPGVTNLTIVPTDWSPDGKFILYQQTGNKTGYDLWLLPDPGSVAGEAKPIPYLQTSFNEGLGQFSPDGHWLAYISDESGQDQVYIQAVPPNGAKWQVSTSAASTNFAGFGPTWRHDGKELYYGSADQKLIAVPTKLGTSVEPGTPQTLFSMPGITAYAPSNDGQRFLVAAPVGTEGTAIPPVTVLTNWQARLKK
jgi:eukaryotic-like serine/threonine-protein kinase